MIVSLALATGTAPRDWWEEEDSTLATALTLLEERAEALEETRHGRR